jgi:hypothetical protein
MYKTVTEDGKRENVANDYKVDMKKHKSSIDISFIRKLLYDVFGEDDLVYTPTWKVDTIDNDPEYNNAPVRLGNKVFGTFWISEGTYETYEFDGSLKKYKYSQFLMPVATIVNFSRQKSIVKTSTIGGLGSVKEIYSLDDWKIEIKGIILPDKNNPPAFQSVQGQMDALQKYHEIAGSIAVEGQIFGDRNIVRITTEKLSFTPIKGKPNMMEYSIEAVSDEDILMII